MVDFNDQGGRNGPPHRRAPAEAIGGISNAVSADITFGPNPARTAGSGAMRGECRPWNET